MNENPYASPLTRGGSFGPPLRDVIGLGGFLVMMFGTLAVAGVEVVVYFFETLFSIPLKQTTPYLNDWHANFLVFCLLVGIPMFLLTAPKASSDEIPS